MDFTYKGYEQMLRLLKKQGYQFINYDDAKNKLCDNDLFVVIMRHDIDMCIDKALLLAKLEKDMGVKSTYFVLLTSDFYNVFSRSNTEKLKAIMSMGHEIGLHFDEMQYADLGGAEDKVVERIVQEARILEKALGQPVKKVSYHRPSKSILEANLEIPGMLNSYGTEFFRDFKYISDSRRCWREPIRDIILSGEFHRLHILTHPFWYNEEEKNIHDSLLEFVAGANKDRYNILRENIRDCEQLLKDGEI